MVICDTDGEMGRYEHRIRVTCKMVGVLFIHRRSN